MAEAGRPCTVLLQPSSNYERPLLAHALRQLGVRQAKEGAEPSLVWCKARDVDWERVLDGSLAANALLVRSSLTRKARPIWY